MTSRGTLILTRGDVVRFLTLEECIPAVRRAFRLYGEGKVRRPGILGVPVHGGGFHCKAGVLGHDREYFAVKLNANFPGNREQWGLPTIQGMIVLSDAENGTPLAIMDSIEITIQRTGAATAVAAAHLARAKSTVATVCGCGNQGRIQLRALLTVLPLRKLFAFDADMRQAEELAREFSGVLDVEPLAGSAALHAAMVKSDVCVTCTPSTAFYVNAGDIRPGTFIAAVGADSEGKQELDPRLFKGNKVVADMADQCAVIGDLHHAIEGGFVSKMDVHAELGEIVAGIRPGRANDEEITIFDSTGMALQDAAAAIVVYEKARQSGACLSVDFSAIPSASIAAPPERS